MRPITTACMIGNEAVTDRVVSELLGLSHGSRNKDYYESILPDERRAGLGALRPVRGTASSTVRISVEFNGWLHSCTRLCTAGRVSGSPKSVLEVGIGSGARKSHTIPASE